MNFLIFNGETIIHGSPVRDLIFFLNLKWVKSLYTRL